MAIRCLTLYFNPTGRITRFTWWIHAVLIRQVVHLAAAFGLLFGIALAFPGEYVGHTEAMLILSVLIATYAASIWSFIAMSVKRLHDRDLSAWYLLIGVLPIIGPLILLVVMGFLKGTIGTNSYGDDQMPEPVPVLADAPSQSDYETDPRFR